MPRQTKDANLSTREARGRLDVTAKPYFRSLDEGLHLGYRKSVAGSAWVIRWYEGAGTYRTANIDGRPDDVLTADGSTVLSWSQAQAAARKLFQAKQRQAAGLDEVPAGPYMVKDAMAGYLAEYEREGKKALSRTRQTIDAMILPPLGEILVAKLTKTRIKAWLDALANAPPRVRTKAGAAQQYRVVEPGPEATRRRRSMANRVLTVLKAALNFGHQEGKIASDDAWRLVKPFREADGARIRTLSDDEALRLVNASPADFRRLVQAALLTGCRYGELIVLQAVDFDRDAGTVYVRRSKSGKPRHVTLDDDGRAFFANLSAGKPDTALLLVRDDGLAWGKSHQFRPIAAACAAGTVPPLSFHELRHTYATRLIKAGVPTAVVALQLGHTGTRMIERHYAHLDNAYVADAVRSAFVSRRLVEPSNIVPLRKAE